MMRVLTCLIVVAVMVVWAVLSIKAGKMLPIDWSQVAILLGALGAKSVQAFAENLGAASTPRSQADVAAPISAAPIPAPTSNLAKASSGAVLALFLFISLVATGCATVQPGSDPLVVRVEQTESVALSTFTAFLKVDNADRAFWRTNAPELHAFAEYLRAPVPDGTNTIQRDLAWCQSLDAIKRGYIAGNVNSNSVAMVMETLEATMSQAQRYLAIASTNTIHQ